MTAPPTTSPKKQIPSNKSSAFVYSGLPAPSYSTNIERFMMIGDTSGTKYIRHVWYVDTPDEFGKYRYSPVEYTECATCQRIYNTEFKRVSELNDDEFQTEFDQKVGSLMFDDIPIPPMPAMN